MKPLQLTGDVSLPELVKILVKNIKVPEVRASSTFTPEQQEFFAATARSFGIVQPIIVRPLGSGDFELVAGKHRLDQQINSGALQVEAIELPADEKTALLMHLAENVARGSVDIVSVARVMKRLQLQGADVQELSRILGKSDTWIRRTLQLLELPDHYQAAIKEGKLTPTHMYQALRLPDLNEVDSALKSAYVHGWNTSIFTNYVENRLAEIQAAKRAAAQTGQPTQVAPPEPEKLAKYRQCLICGSMKPIQEVHAEIACDQCLKIARYISTQLGSNEDTMQTLFNALKLYFGMRQQQQDSTEPSIV